MIWGGKNLGFGTGVQAEPARSGSPPFSLPQTDRRRASCNVSRVGSPHAISRIRTLEFDASAVSLAPPQTVVLMQATGQRCSRGAEGAVRTQVCPQPPRNG
eukprot:COSAG04_NODE_1664_length_6014_cov_7.936422_4_plen_101_part_00